LCVLCTCTSKNLLFGAAELIRNCLKGCPDDL
jgi:hypothetical protein